MTNKSSNPNQLCFSIGRPLEVLLQELQTTSRSPSLREAAKQMLEGLHTLKLANQTDRAKSVKAQTAIYEILTK
ncbi:hypothetical protein [Okeania sp. SIO1I7]|uniref:hypothetical protein n=1 Tax=Okeania sp. SIO1I7 TaxID=2607772 RepID=UPI0013FA1319|nr:hypothetical protein [Okeania sp. SIO1I7]NET27004.1 hypothetical protein [Okeania sp. SIO1I7]